MQKVQNSYQSFCHKLGELKTREIALYYPYFLFFLIVHGCDPKVHSCIASLSIAANYLKILIHLPILILYVECSIMSVIFNIQEIVKQSLILWYLTKPCPLNSMLRSFSANLQYFGISPNYVHYLQCQGDYWPTSNTSTPHHKIPAQVGRWYLIDCTTSKCICHGL